MLLQGEQGEENRHRPGEGHCREEAAGGKRDDSALPTTDEGARQSGNNYIDNVLPVINMSCYETFHYRQCTFQLESNSSALELLTSDLTNKDEAMFINKATRDINKNNKSFKDMVSN